MVKRLKCIMTKSNSLTHQYGHHSVKYIHTLQQTLIIYVSVYHGVMFSIVQYEPSFTLKLKCCTMLRLSSAFLLGLANLKYIQNSLYCGKHVSRFNSNQITFKHYVYMRYCDLCNSLKQTKDEQFLKLLATVTGFILFKRKLSVN